MVGSARAALTAAVFLLAAGAAHAQQQQAAPAVPAPAAGHHGMHGAAPATGVKRTDLHQTPLLHTEDRVFQLYVVDFAPGGATPRHLHPGDEIAHVVEGTVVLEMQGEEPRTFNAGQSFHPRPNTPHVARNASATAPAKLVVSSITEAGKPSTVPVPAQ